MVNASSGDLGWGSTWMSAHTFKQSDYGSQSGPEQAWWVNCGGPLTLLVEIGILDTTISLT